jgi:hypothetical protein
VMRGGKGGEERERTGGEDKGLFNRVAASCEVVLLVRFKPFQDDRRGFVGE